MTTTLLPATDTTTDAAPAVVRPPRRRAGRRLVALLVAALATLGLTLTLCAPANAYYNTTYSGRQGRIIFSAATGSSVVARPGYRFSTPSLIVYRNGAINAGYQQELQVNTTLQRWNGTGWANTDGMQQQVLIDMGTNGTVLVGGSVLVSRIAVAGYFRVVTTVRWGSASALPYWSGVYTGLQEFAPNAIGDMRCGLAACADRVVSNGSLYVWG